ncbi:MAG: hypothetical protein M1818_000071 [Claussenomyces sp. TS43310]|nr:MAG: hypothetical protein M1818_000071 [Claussenomyces sp. TS43310]
MIMLGLRETSPSKKPDGSTLLTIIGKCFSNSQRREFKDASGLPLFELCPRYFRSEDAWFGELPGGGGENLLSVALKGSMRRDKLEVTLTNAAAPEEAAEDGTLVVRGQDFSRIAAHVMVQENRVADIRRIINGRRQSGRASTRMGGPIDSRN